jgi:hypothetical protein
VTTITSDAFDEDVSGAKASANRSPVFITDGCQPTHVLLTIADYLRLTSGRMNLAEALAQPAADFDFQPRMGTLVEFLLASPLRGADLDVDRINDVPRDVEF